jgi:hypothetical protein
MDEKLDEIKNIIYMKEALLLAQIALKQNEVPVGSQFLNLRMYYSL